MIKCKICNKDCEPRDTSSNQLISYKCVEKYSHAYYTKYKNNFLLKESFFYFTDTNYHYEIVLLHDDIESISYYNLYCNQGFHAKHIGTFSIKDFVFDPSNILSTINKMKAIALFS